MFNVLIEVPKGLHRVNPTFFKLLTSPKFLSMIIMGIIVICLLLSNKLGEKIRITLLLISTFLFGIAGNLPITFFKSFSMHPSPVCAATKPFLYGFRTPFMVALLVIFILTILGPKLFCSYICPVGTLQELIAKIGDIKNIKRKSFSFKFLNGIRISIFLIFIIFSVTKIYHIAYKGKILGVSIYDHINPFHGFEFTNLNGNPLFLFIHFLPLILTIVLSFKIYRPFCYAVCPLGLYTNLIEQISLIKIKLIKNKCTKCNLCVDQKICPAISEILKESEYRPDCFACNRCIKVCGQKALKYGIKKCED